METLIQDVRHAARSFRRSPGFAAAVIATIALGIGANTAIFSLLDAVILKSLPVREAGRLVFLRWSSPGGRVPEAIDDIEGSGREDSKTGRYVSDSLSFPVYEQVARRSRSFSTVAGVDANDENLNVRVGERSATAVGQFVTGNFFSTLGVAAQRGRLLIPSDDVRSAAMAVVISDSAWKRWFDGRPLGEGRALVVNGWPATAVGVAPAEFFGLDASAEPDLWLPLRSAARIMRLGDFGDELFSSRRTWWLRIVGRLRTGVSPAEALAESKIAFDQNLVGKNGTPLPPSLSPTLELLDAGRGVDSLRVGYSRPLALLMGIVGLLLLLACANVAGLFVARSVSRRREFAVRASLGAGRARLIRQLLTESAMLTLGACVIAIPFARVLAASLLALLSNRGQEVAVQPTFDLRVLGFSVVLALFTAALFGLVPALRASRTDLTSDLKATSPASSPGGRLGSRLVASQVALTFVLLVVAGLFLRTLDNLRNVSLGFERRHLLLLRIEPGLNGYEGTRLARYSEELRRRLEAVPGIASAAVSQNAPIGGGLSSTMVREAGAPIEKRLDVDRNLVGSRFFETLGIPLLAGRPIREDDDETRPHVAVVSARLAQDLFGKANPIGRVIDFGSAADPRRYEVVGLVGDSRYYDLRGEVPRIVYLPYRQTPAIPRSLTYEIRARADAATVMAAVRRAAVSLDPNVPIYRLETQAGAISRVLTFERIFAALTSAFGMLGLLLAGVGLYSALAYAVAGRTREIGIRMALGADRARIVAMVLRSGLRQALAGAVVGAAAAIAAGRLLESQLFGLSAHDPFTLAGSLTVIVVSAVLACAIPARRASRVEPAQALRSE